MQQDTEMKPVEPQEQQQPVVTTKVTTTTTTTTEAKPATVTTTTTATTATTGAATREPVPESTEEACQCRLGPWVYVALAIAILVLTVVGTATNWLTYDTTTTRTHYTLWDKYVETQGVVAKTKVGDEACAALVDHFKASEAFSIITIFFALCMAIAGIVWYVAGASKWVCAVLAFVTFLTSLVAWAPIMRLYFVSFCGVASFEARRYELASGMGLYITAWVLCFVAAVYAVVNPSTLMTPRALYVVFTIVASVSFLFSVIATPLPFAHLFLADRTIEVSVWKVMTTRGGSTTSMSLEEVGCGRLYAVANFAQAFAIVTIASTALAAIGGAAAIFGKVGRGVLLVLGFIATLTALITIGAISAIYYRRFCAMATLDQQLFVWGAGAALFAAVMVGMLVATLLLLLQGLCMLRKQVGGGAMKLWSVVVFIVMCVTATILMVVGLALNAFNKGGVAVSWDNVFDGTQVVEFPCTELRDYMHASLALGVIAIVVMAVAVFAGVGQLFKPVLRVPASVVALAASALMLVSWAVAVGLYYKSVCGAASFNDQGVTIDVGLRLTIAAWCVALLAGVLNLAVA